MKSIVILVISLVVMVSCFFISGLFFLSSGMIDENTGNLNEWRTFQLVSDLDKIPLMHFDTADMEFTSYGTVIDITNTSLIITSRKGNESFLYKGNLSSLNTTGGIKVSYTFSPEGEEQVTRLRVLYAENSSDINCTGW